MRYINAVIFSTLLLLAACHSNTEDIQRLHSKIVSSYNFNYAIEAGSAIHLSQVFDDKKNTYFMFSAEPSSAPEVSLPGESEVTKLIRSGNYWLLKNCILPAFQISIDNKIIFVRNTQLPPNKQIQQGSPETITPLDNCTFEDAVKEPKKSSPSTRKAR